MYTVIILLLINAAGYLLKYYQLDRYIILMGFRFHLSLLLPALMLLRKDYLSFARRSLTKPEGGMYLGAYLGLLPLSMLTAVLFILGLIDLSDPDFLYELGLSSLIDYPVYLIWNLPQLLVTALFLKYVSEDTRFRFPVIFFAMLFLFAYELAPLPKEKPDAAMVYSYIPAVFVFSLFLSRFRNVYAFSVTVFTALWAFILVYGSSLKVMVNLLLARTFDKWDGVLMLDVPYRQFLFPALLAVMLVLFLIPFALSYRKSR